MRILSILLISAAIFNIVHCDDKDNQSSENKHEISEHKEINDKHVDELKNENKHEKEKQNNEFDTDGMIYIYI